MISADAAFEEIKRAFFVYLFNQIRNAAITDFTGKLILPVSKVPPSIRDAAVSTLENQGYKAKITTFGSGGGNTGYLLDINWEQP